MKSTTMRAACGPRGLHPVTTSDGVRMVRFDVARLDPRYAVPATGWHRLAVALAVTVGLAAALLLIKVLS